MASIRRADLQEVLSKPIVWVAALGYFIDIFDLILFGMLRIQSLESIGITESQALEDYGLLLDNWQMGGMLLGGILWGILGDKKGRLSVLFGSIITYSFANIANGFVTEVNSYALWRFIAGIGLAGELGAGITIVSEVLSPRLRGIGTAFVATLGLMGAVVGGAIVKSLQEFQIADIDPWRSSYFIGGLMGLVLLFLRLSVAESEVFKKAKTQPVARGNLKTLFKNKKTFYKYLGVIFIAMPVWYAVQLYAKYSPEMAEALGMEIPNKSTLAINAISLIYLGLTLGDALSGTISNLIESRKKTIFLFLSVTVLGIILFWILAPLSLNFFYSCIFLIGLGTGYWAVFMSTAAESFGTNIRSTVTNTAPNFVRGSVILMNMSYLFFQNSFGLSRIQSNILLGLIIFSLAFWGWSQLKETFHKDLDYIEE